MLRSGTRRSVAVFARHTRRHTQRHTQTQTQAASLSIARTTAMARETARHCLCVSPSLSLSPCLSLSLAVGSSSAADQSSSLSLSLSLALALTLTAITTIASSSEALSHCETEAATEREGEKERVYRLSEVSTHTTRETGIWCTYGESVYDITRFVANHPGGREKILLAAGKDIEPYWNVYRQHLGSPLAREILASLRIGRLHEEDIRTRAALREATQARENENNNNNPYARDPVVSPVMRFYQKQPINAEAPGFLLRDSWITPVSLWFVRNHHPVPALALDYCAQRDAVRDAHTDTHTDTEKDANKNKAPIEYNIDLSFAQDLLLGEEEREKHMLSLSVDDLKTRFRAHRVTSSLQCGGNRRAEMSRLERTNGSSWEISAMANAQWTGVRVRDLLRSVGITEDVVFGDYEETEDESSLAQNTSVPRERRIRHLQILSLDGLEASIPIRKALSLFGDCLLAYEMNGEPLPAQHGGPLRLIVPGHVGVRNVKWVQSLRLSSEEAHGPWQRGMAYKGFGPSVRSLEGIDVEKIVSLQEQPVQSAITHPHSAAPFIQGERNTVQGYAYSGGGRGIARVDVSIDGGKTWKTAALTEGAEQPLDRAWAWTFWECDFDIPAATDNTPVQTYEVVCKATDAAHNVQPDTVEGIWNLRGINNNAWHRVSTQAVPETSDDDEEDDE